jgi:hypothetical protein
MRNASYKKVLPAGVGVESGLSGGAIGRGLQTPTIGPDAWVLAMSYARAWPRAEVQLIFDWYEKH